MRTKSAGVDAAVRIRCPAFAQFGDVGAGREDAVAAQ